MNKKKQKEKMNIKYIFISQDIIRHQKNKHSINYGTIQKQKKFWILIIKMI